MNNSGHHTDTHLAIIERCKKGDRKAFHELYDLYAKAMLNVSVRILNNTEEAQEVIQDSFLAAFENIHRYDKTHAFGAWLKRIVINRSLNVLKKRKAVFIPIEEDSHYGTGETNDEGETVEFDVNMIRQCIQELPDGYRTIFSLYLFEKYSHKEISELLNISEGTSKSQYNRAKKKLTELVKQKTMTHGR
ncbi:MAG: polymerase sigma factor [Bacteroidetes bacterium]|jgi:RNA polymerase sigma-70 factor (ECF subfamily)|nr:polymerase sigma factor [Bacteroidota bacterium]